METVLLIAQIIVLLCLSGLAVYLITVLVKFRELLGTVDTNLKDVTAKALPTLENLEVITSKLRSVVENFDEQLAILRSSVETIRSVTNSVADFQHRIQSAIESPIMEVMNTIGGIIRGFTSFLSRITGGSSE